MKKRIIKPCKVITTNLSEIKIEKMKNIQKHVFLIGSVYIWYEILKKHIKKSGYAEYGGFSLEEWPPNIKKVLKIIIFYYIVRKYLKHR